MKVYDIITQIPQYLKQNQKRPLTLKLWKQRMYHGILYKCLFFIFSFSTKNFFVNVVIC
jgi:hypothetical protein